MGKTVFFRMIDCIVEDNFHGMSKTNHNMERSKGQ